MIESADQKSFLALRVLVGLSIVLALVVVILGAYTRLVDAGLGCPDWPGCYGHLTVPQTESEITQAEELYPDVPVEKGKAWVEMIHRYFASGLGLLAIVITVVAWLGKQPLKLPVAFLVLVVVQGAFGAWTVTLKLWPQVVTAHLLGGFATMALLWFYFVRLIGMKAPLLSPGVRHHVHVVLVLLVIQIALGGWVSSNYAALACPDFPFCHGSLLPEMDLLAGFNIFQDVGPNYLGGQLSNDARVAIQMVHRLGAFIVLAAGFWLVVRLSSRQIRAIVGGLLALQFVLGVANVAFSLPLAVAVLHNAIAAVLLLSVLTLLTGRKDELPTSDTETV